MRPDGIEVPPTIGNKEGVFCILEYKHMSDVTDQYPLISEECGRGEGWGVYGTLMESDTVGPSGLTEGDTRPGLIRKEPKDLSVCESEDRGCG